MAEEKEAMFGEWMGGWKAAGEKDEELERIDRQKAAFGAATLSSMKRINVLIIGCRGTGIEVAKNLVLSNVGSVSIFDDAPPAIVDLGANFYLEKAHVAAGDQGRAACVLRQVQSLNPYCSVGVFTPPESSPRPSAAWLDDEDVRGTGTGFTAVVVTELLPRAELDALNEAARARGAAFIMAVNTGVTAALFSDFGPSHAVLDPNGEPLSVLPVSNVEVLELPPLLRVSGVEEGAPVVIVTLAQAHHGLEDGDEVALDDMQGDLAPLNGRRCAVRAVGFLSPQEAKLDIQDPGYLDMLKRPTSDVVATFQRQYDAYSAAVPEGGKLRTRHITMFNRLALVLPEGLEASAFGGYTAGGLLNQVRVPDVRAYKPLSEALAKGAAPPMLNNEDMEAGVGVDVQLCLAAALDFYDAESRWPRLHDGADADRIVELAKAASERFRAEHGDGDACWLQRLDWGFPSGEARELDERRARRFSRLFPTELTGLCAYLGGAAAQEVIKKTGRFSPVDGFILHDDQGLVVDDEPANVGPPAGTRYDHLASVMGKDFVRRAASQRVFLVGCGALGCEFLKGMALMGVGTGAAGRVWVTDMDTIEVSNLSRQFLFRQGDVGSPKSEAGARAVRAWNPSMNITPLVKKVGPDTEDFFNDGFWEGLDLCWNALDNVHARRYTDSCCQWFGKPLLESGTLGTKSNSDVILPYRTKSYSEGKESDDNEAQIAMCTLRSFPYLPLHCIEFAKQAYFADMFEFGPEAYEEFRSSPDAFFARLDDMESREQLRALQLIKYLAGLQQGGAVTFDTCIRAAFDRMVADFRTNILALLSTTDKLERETGQPFWTGTKRRPRALDWDPESPAAEHLEYLFAAANLYAYVFGLEAVRDRAAFAAAVAACGLRQPDFSADSGGEVDVSEGEDDSGAVDPEELMRLMGEVRALDASALAPGTAHDFEKDDDANFHVDFLTASTNMRAWNYNIKASDRHHVKVTAGRIIPALATTTAMVCGLVDMEFCKLVLGLQNSSRGREAFLNSNVNLAVGNVAFNVFNPEAPIVHKTGLPEGREPATFTVWDRIVVDGELTLAELVAELEARFGMRVARLFKAGQEKGTMLYNADDNAKLGWAMDLTDSGEVVCDDGVFSMWPQMRMAVQMLRREGTSANQRKVFEAQFLNTKRALDATKASFRDRLDGPVSAAYRAIYRPAAEPEDAAEEARAKAAEAQAYFDGIFEARPYLKLQGIFTNEAGEDVTLPLVRYNYRF